MTTKTTKTDLVADRFRKGSDLAKMFTLLSDGKPRTIPEIQKVVKAEVEKNIGVGKFITLKKFGQISGKFDMVKTDDGKIQMVLPEKKSRKKAA